MLHNTSHQGDGLVLGSARAGTGTRLLGKVLAWGKQVLNSDEFAQGTAACTWGLRACCIIPVTRGMVWCWVQHVLGLARAYSRRSHPTY